MRKLFLRNLGIGRKPGLLPLDGRKVDQRAIYMTNWEVAHAMTCNALIYAQEGDMATVIHNLTYIELLLQHPEDQNQDFIRE